MVTGFDRIRDIVTFDINIDNNTYLSFGTSSQVQTGETVYTIGSPYGIKNTLADGLISAVSDDTIKITLPISFGSSVGALINEYGEVIAITSGGIVLSVNVGLAIPIEFAKNMDNQSYNLNQFNEVEQSAVDQP